MKPSRRSLGLALLGAAVLTAALLAVSNDGHSGSLASAAQKIALIRTSTDPDGARLELYLFNADGSGERRLVEAATPSPNTGFPYEFDSGNEVVWSPDGRMIPFVGVGDDGNMDVHVVRADGRGQQRLTRHPGVDGNPAWSPDGRKIAFTRRSREWNFVGKTYIHVMNADGSGQRRLTHGHIHFSVAWSPDGQKMLFERRNPRHPRGLAPGEFPEELYVMNADGSGQRRLTRNPAEDQFPVWSPDGQMIAFERDDATGWELLVMAADGRGERRLMRTDAAVPVPGRISSVSWAWSPAPK